MQADGGGNLQSTGSVDFIREVKDKIARQVMFIKSEPILSQYHLWDLLTESNWRPMEGKLGFLPFLAGTFWCTVRIITKSFIN